MEDFALVSNSKSSAGNFLKVENFTAHVTDLMAQQSVKARHLGVNTDELSDDELVNLVIEEGLNPDGFYFNAMTQRTIQHTTPSVALHYPEPFIASPSTIHDDIFFIHILQFQY
jgi:hypothetical protein